MVVICDFIEEYVECNVCAAALGLGQRQLGNTLDLTPVQLGCAQPLPVQV